MDIDVLLLTGLMVVHSYTMMMRIPGADDHCYICTNALVIVHSSPSFI